MAYLSLAALWLPILLSAVIVFVVSSILHMALPFHKNDYRQLPGPAHHKGCGQRDGELR